MADRNSSAAPHGWIEGLSFAPYGSDSQPGAPEINSTDVAQGNMPAHGGINNLQLGSTRSGDRCETCFNTKGGGRSGAEGCLAHTGVHFLAVPVPSPLFIQTIHQVLRVICPECRNLRMPPNERGALAMAGTFSGRLKKLVARSARYGTCWSCGSDRFSRVTRDQTDNVSFIEKGARGAEGRRLTTTEIAATLGGLGPEDARWLGLNPDMHPRHLMIHGLPVLSPVMRPDARNASGRITPDDLTTLYMQIIKTSTAIPAGTGANGAPISADVSERVRYLATAIYDTIRGGDNSQDKPTTRVARPGADKAGKFRMLGGQSNTMTLKVRLTGKFGLLRRFQQSRRSGEQGRSVIASAPMIPLDTVQIPLHFARTMQKKMYITEANKAVAAELLRNGRNTYPGCTRVVRAKTGASYWAGGVSQDFQLEPGDVLYRDLQNGDTVMLNRNPSLQKMSAIALRVFVGPPGMNVIKFNVHICSPFNADYDGDEMQVWNPVTDEASIELQIVSFMDKMVINSADGSPVHGAVYDDIEGGTELSEAPPMSRWQAMLVFNRLVAVPDFGHGDGLLGKTGPAFARTYSGRNILSMYLAAHAPINFSGPTKLAEPTLQQFFPLSRTDTMCVIRAGLMTSGRLDGNVYGEGKRNGLHHQIVATFGAGVGLDVVFAVQQMTFGYMRRHGHSIGYGDLMLSRPTMAALRDIMAKVAAEGAALEQQLLRGLIVPPRDSTVEEFYAELLSKAMGVKDEILAVLLNGLDRERNQLIMLALSGAKAKMEHLCSILGAVTSITEAGKLPRRNFGYKRGWPLQQRCENTPDGRGFVGNSYARGMTLLQMLYASMNGRMALILKSLMTSKAGELYRDTVKNGESFILSHFRSVDNGRSMVRPLYGNDGFDPVNTIMVPIDDVYLSDAKFAAALVGEAALPLPAGHPAVLERSQRADWLRASFVASALENEASDAASRAPDRVVLPCNVMRLVGDAICNAPKLPAPSPKEFERMLRAVALFDRTVPQFYANARVPLAALPRPYLSGARNLQLHIALALAPVHLAKMSPPTLAGVLQTIERKFLAALAIPGSCVGILAAEVFGEPITQAMLNSTHAQVSANKNAMNTADAVRMLLSARPDTSQAMYVAGRPGVPAELLAGRLELTSLRRVTSRWEILHERFGAPVYPAHAHEAAFVAAFVKATPATPPPGKTLHICVRILIDRVGMTTRNVRIEMIVNAITRAFPHTYVVYSPESARAGTPLVSPAGPDTLMLRVYFTPEMFPKHNPELTDFVRLAGAFLDLSVRGVENVSFADVSTASRTVRGTDGSYKAVRNDIVVTAGSNLYDVFLRDDVDPYNTLTDSNTEHLRMFGNESVRARIESRITMLAGGKQFSACHLGQFADAMTGTGEPVSLTAGIMARNPSAVCLGASHKNALRIWHKAAINGVKDPMQDPSAWMTVGCAGRAGTRFSRLQINEEQVRKCAGNPADLLDALEASA